MIKAIETEYAGYKFRSRLEARWAVFFDAMGIQWEYEPQGYVLSDGTKYLPDFYLPWFDCFVEIKPKVAKEIWDAKRKLEMLYEKGDCFCMLCVDEPAKHNITVFATKTKAVDYESFAFGSPCLKPKVKRWFGARFLEGVEYECSGFSKHYITLSLTCNEYCNFMKGNRETTNCVIPDYGIEYFRNDFYEAKIKAKQARFEHGETPKR